MLMLRGSLKPLLKPIFSIRYLAIKQRLEKAIEEDVSKLPVSMRDKEKMRERYGLGKDPREPTLNQVYDWIRERQQEMKEKPKRRLSRQVRRNQ
jgi:Asp-tRNA(Asn)/Glu-tRNA(Gln) amidotransferase B subunit